MAAILKQYPDVKCQLHSETGAADTAPLPLAEHLHLDYVSDVQQIMDRLAESRAQADPNPNPNPNPNPSPNPSPNPNPNPNPYPNPNPNDAQVHATRSLVNKVIVPLQEHGNLVHVYLTESSGAGSGRKGHCEMVHELRKLFPPEAMQAYDVRPRFSGQAEGFRHTLDSLKEHADPASYDLVIIARHDLYWNAQIDQLRPPADLRKLSFFSRCAGNNGDLSHCVMDLLVTMPGSLFAAFDGVATTGCCYAPGFRHGAGHGCYNQTYMALGRDQFGYHNEIGVLTDWRPRNSKVIQQRDMGHCPIGALAGAEWDTDDPDESLPLVQGYAAAAMGRSCAIPEVGSPADAFFAHFLPPAHNQEQRDLWVAAAPPASPAAHAQAQGQGQGQAQGQGQGQGQG